MSEVWRKKVSDRLRSGRLDYENKETGEPYPRVFDWTDDVDLASFLQLALENDWEIDNTLRLASSTRSIPETERHDNGVVYPENDGLPKPLAKVIASCLLFAAVEKRDTVPFEVIHLEAGKALGADEDYSPAKDFRRVSGYFYNRARCSSFWNKLPKSYGFFKFPAISENGRMPLNDLYPFSPGRIEAAIFDEQPILVEQWLSGRYIRDLTRLLTRRGELGTACAFANHMRDYTREIRADDVDVALAEIAYAECVLEKKEPEPEVCIDAAKAALGLIVGLERSQDYVDETEIRRILARAEYMRSEYADALKQFEAVAEGLADGPDLKAMVSCLRHLAEAHCDNGEYEEAFAKIDRALRLYPPRDDLRHSCLATRWRVIRSKADWKSLGASEVEYFEEFTQSIPGAERGKEIEIEHGYPRAFVALSKLRIDPVKALEDAKSGMDRYRYDEVTDVMLLELRINLFIQQTKAGEYTEALGHYENEVRKYRSRFGASRHLLVEALEECATNLDGTSKDYVLGHICLAELYEEILSETDETNAEIVEKLADALIALGKMENTCGKLDAASDYYTKALEWLRVVDPESGDVTKLEVQLGTILVELASEHRCAEQWDEAASVAKRASNLLRQKVGSEELLDEALFLEADSLYHLDHLDSDGRKRDDLLALYRIIVQRFLPKNRSLKDRRLLKELLWALWTLSCHDREEKVERIYEVGEATHHNFLDEEFVVEGYLLSAEGYRENGQPYTANNVYEILLAKARFFSSNHDVESAGRILDCLDKVSSLPAPIRQELDRERCRPREEEYS